MYIVHQTYLDRADAAVRTQRRCIVFPKEDHYYDVILWNDKKFGLVPEVSYASGSHVW